MRVIKESIWQQLADITDKTQLEWREVFQDLNHHGVYHLSLIHISEPTRQCCTSRMPSSA